MKKIAFILPTLIIATTAQHVLAQSSVTLYGRLNTTIEYQKIGKDKGIKVEDNNSRFGLRGEEDLGGGLKAKFVLEQAFNASENQSFGDFNREAHIGLSSEKLGTIRVGHWFPGSYYAVPDYVSLHNHDTGNSSDALYSFSAFPEVNKVGYITPTWNGFNAEVAVAIGDKLEKEKHAYDLSANYTVGNLYLGAGYSEHDKAKQFAMSGLYTLSAFTFGGYAQRETIEGSANGENRNIFRLVGMYTLNNSEFHANIGHTSKGGVAEQAAKQYTLGYNYNLSKRTKVYTYFTTLEPMEMDSSKFSSIAFGIRHNF